MNLKTYATKLIVRDKQTACRNILKDKRGAIIIINIILVHPLCWSESGTASKSAQIDKLKIDFSKMQYRKVGTDLSQNKRLYSFILIKYARRCH